MRCQQTSSIANKKQYRLHYPREKLYGRKISVEKELKHGFGDYVQLHTDVVDNSLKPRTSGTIALMSTGNLEGSWYYMLLGTKATPLPMTDKIISYLNDLARSRKSKTVIDSYNFDVDKSAEFDDDVGVSLPHNCTRPYTTRERTCAVRVRKRAKCAR